ncbi:MAG: hypothetical protein H6739_01195 [Alphaproteobacteria bacterium]|nr:hypothetical protein [Alphaproteobacteria bacterium]
MRSATPLLTLLLLSGPALAQDDDPPLAVPVEQADPPADAPEDEAADPDAAGAPEEAGEAGEPGVLVPDPDAEALDPEAAERLGDLQDEATQESDPADDNAAAGWSYQDGRMAGSADAKLSSGYGLHGLAGLGGGLACSACGCIGVTAAELLVSPGVPQGPWQGQDASYQRGYIDGYRKTVRQRRAVYALVGGSLGTAVAFGTGVAVGAYTGEFPFFF